jgi:hypothetical protein
MPSTVAAERRSTRPGCSGLRPRLTIGFAPPHVRLGWRVVGQDVRDRFAAHHVSFREPSKSERHGIRPMLYDAHSLAAAGASAFAGYYDSGQELHVRVARPREAASLRSSLRGTRPCGGGLCVSGPSHVEDIDMGQSVSAAQHAAPLAPTERARDV